MSSVAGVENILTNCFSIRALPAATQQSAAPRASAGHPSGHCPLDSQGVDQAVDSLGQLNKSFKQSACNKFWAQDDLKEGCETKFSMQIFIKS